MNQEEKRYGVSIVWKFILGFIFTLAALGLCMVFVAVFNNICRVI